MNGNKKSRKDILNFRDFITYSIETIITTIFLSTLKEVSLLQLYTYQDVALP